MSGNKILSPGVWKKTFLPETNKDTKIRFINISLFETKEINF